MELELKHLALYLPYSVRITKEDWGKIFKLDNDGTTLNCVGIDYVLNCKAKPILRPIDDLSDFVENLYGTLENQDITDFMDDDFLNEHQIYSIVDLEGTNPKYMPFGTLEVLLKYHFDVFDLISQGLALSIHDFPQAVA